MNTDVKARDLLPQAEIMAQAAENCTRLAGALLRMRRVLDDTNPAGTNFHRAAERINDEFAALIDGSLQQRVIKLYYIGLIVSQKTFGKRNLLGCNILFVQLFTCCVR